MKIHPSNNRKNRRNVESASIFFLVFLILFFYIELVPYLIISLIGLFWVLFATLKLFSTQIISVTLEEEDIRITGRSKKSALIKKGDVKKIGGGWFPGGFIARPVYRYRVKLCSKFFFGDELNFDKKCDLFLEKGTDPEEIILLKSFIQKDSQKGYEEFIQIPLIFLTVRVRIKKRHQI